jgi:hypothetical protein
MAIRIPPTPPSWINLANNVRAAAQNIDATYNVSGNINNLQNSVRQGVTDLLAVVERKRANQSQILSSSEKQFLVRTTFMQAVKVDNRTVPQFLDRLVKQINRERNWNRKLVLATNGFTDVYNGLNMHFNAHRQLSIQDILQIDQHNANVLATALASGRIDDMNRIVSLPAYMQARTLQSWQMQNKKQGRSYLSQALENQSYRNMNQQEFGQTASLLRQLVFRMGEQVQDIQGRIASGNTP